MTLFSSTSDDISLEILRRDLQQDLYPQYYRLVQLALTLPVGTATSERSFSAMRRIKNWLRSSMNQDRFSSLAVLNIEPDLTAKLNPEDIAEAYASDKRRRSLQF